jgi:hypothetical protein
MLVLAGCSGGTPADGGASPEDGTADGEDGTEGMTDDSSTTGTVEFYVSDKPSRIDDFRHLNVTIDRVGFYRAESETETATATATNATVSTVANDSDDTEANESESDEDGSDDSENSGELTRDVDARSVDLTRLRGPNATLIGTPEIPAGNYTKVFVYVDSINATLKDGSTTNVKLPSNKLQLTKGFELEPNGTVQFVYDISIFKAGNSGKYILKPVISESGADQEIESVDDSTDAMAESEENDDEDATVTETPTATATPTGTDQPRGNQSNGAGN